MSLQMKAALALVAILVYLAAPVAAQNISPEFQFWTDGGKVQAQYDFYAEKPVSKNWSFVAWGQKDPGWGELIAGFGRKLTPWATINFFAGVEQFDSPWRVSVSSWMGGRGYNSLIIVTTGGSGLWYKYTLTKRVGNRLDVGVLSQLAIGTGPMFQVGVGKFAIWSAPVTVRTDGTISNLSGVLYNFK